MYSLNAFSASEIHSAACFMIVSSIIICIFQTFNNTLEIIHSGNSTFPMGFTNSNNIDKFSNHSFRDFWSFLYFIMLTEAEIPAVLYIVWEFLDHIIIDFIINNNFGKKKSLSIDANMPAPMIELLQSQQYPSRTFGKFINVINN